eukprot:11183662-Lingulodinium_polyedra.AAC.1
MDPPHPPVSLLRRMPKQNNSPSTAFSRGGDSQGWLGGQQHWNLTRARAARAAAMPQMDTTLARNVD